MEWALISVFQMAPRTPVNHWHFHSFLPPCNCTHAGIIQTPYGELTTKHKEEVLTLVVRLNGDRGDSSVIAALARS